MGLAFIPLAIASSIAFFELLKDVGAIGKEQNFFIYGIIAYALMHLLLYQPEYLYVLGHEAVHAFFAWLFGGQVKSMKVSKKGGSVATTKTNFIITLSPYFFPIYTIFITLLYLILMIFRAEVVDFAHFFIFLVGFTLAFHVIMTASTLRTKQQDIVENGYIFSLGLIYVVNILVLVLVLSLVFKNIHVIPFLKAAYCNTVNIVEKILTQLFAVR